MRHLQVITDILNTLDVGQPVVTIRLSGSSNLRVIESNWSPNIKEYSFHNNLINQSARRKMSSTEDGRGYVVDMENTIEVIKDQVISSIMKIYTNSCTNKEPRRTKLYKEILSLVRSANRPDKIELLSFMFDIAEYNDSVTREVSLTSPVNQVHRKNIYKLFEIMESKHGSKKNSDK